MNAFVSNLSQSETIPLGRAVGGGPAGHARMAVFDRAAGPVAMAIIYVGLGLTALLGASMLYGCATFIRALVS